MIWPARVAWNFRLVSVEEGSSLSSLCCETDGGGFDDMASRGLGVSGWPRCAIRALAAAARLFCVSTRRGEVSMVVRCVVATGSSLPINSSGDSVKHGNRRWNVGDGFVIVTGRFDLFVIFSSPFLVFVLGGDVVVFFWVCCNVILCI